MNVHDRSHRRLNQLTGEWVLVSPHRTQRPWQGQHEPVPSPSAEAYDPHCYLCPGNARAGGQSNPEYRGSYAFDNDFSALSPPGKDHNGQAPGDTLFCNEPVSGHCRVVCYSHHHDRHLGAMNAAEVSGVLGFLFAEFARLDQHDDVAYVQVFENRGEMMGCSNPHPHAQIWATGSIPDIPLRESRQQDSYFATHGRLLLQDYLAAEEAEGLRLVCANEAAVSLVPYWAVWPFETLLLPRAPVGCPAQMSAETRDGLARVLRQTLLAYDWLFAAPMPYSMGFHARPGDGGKHPGWQFHGHIYPPLLRSATVRKHMVGFEMLGMPQRDITPEAAAQRLRDALDKTDE
jgi:UDPglucose--hexose-1-phosphate uridylyltransferase